MARRLAFIAGALSAGLVACTPHLTSPPGTDDTGAWEAPENSWPVGEPPPADLEGEGFSEGQVVPEVRLLDQYGDEVSLWQFYGMVLALDVSTGWCAPCAALADEVDAVAADYADQGFVYVTIMPENSQGAPPSQEDLQAWAAEHGITQPILADDQGWGYQIAVEGFPHVAVVGRDLRVAVAKVSPTQDDAIRAAIEDAL